MGTYTEKPKSYNLRRVVEQLPDVWPKQTQVLKATGTDGNPVDAVGNFLSNSCFSNDLIWVNATRCGKKTTKAIEIMPSNVKNEGELKTSNPYVLTR